MSWNHLNHAQEPSVWSHRDSPMQYGIPTSRASEESMIHDLEHSSSLPLSSYTVQYPNYLASSMVHPNMGSERHARKPSLSFSFGDESFESGINSPISSRDMVGDSLYFSPAVSPTEPFSQDDSVISIHREWGLPSPTTSKTSMASNSFESIPNGRKAEVQKPSPANSVATNPSKKSVRARKKNHNEIERCYRNRLNDKIECLAQYLFTPGASESQSGRARPPKCLVISRATERLKELEHRNLTLESENEALKRQVAVMDHLFAASNNGSVPPS